MDRTARAWVFLLVLSICFLNSFWYSYTFTERATPLTPWEASPDPTSPPPSSHHPSMTTLLDESWRMPNLVDRHDFRFLLNQDRCSDNGSNGDGVFLLIFVHSAPSHVELRDAIRRTWGAEDNGALLSETVRLVFLLGVVNAAAEQAAIEDEARRYGDIVQGNFLDSYRNLTYKHVMGLKWVAHFCRGARFVLKSDDDTFLDIFTVVELLKRRFGSTQPADLMACTVYRNAFVKRSHRSKWFVAVRDFRPNFYPTYCSGWTIVMSTDVVLRLYVESANLTYFWIDDVVVSGILVQRIGIEHASLDWWDYSFQWSPLQAWLRRMSSKWSPVFGLPNVDADAIYRLWNETVHRHRGDVNR